MNSVVHYMFLYTVSWGANKIIFNVKENMGANLNLCVREYGIKYFIKGSLGVMDLLFHRYLTSVIPLS